MSTEYQITFKQTPAGDPLVFVALRTEKTVVASTAELNFFKDKKIVFDKEGSAWAAGMMDKLLTMLSQAKSAPPGTFLGLETPWAPIEEEAAQAIIDTFDKRRGGLLMVTA